MAGPGATNMQYFLPCTNWRAGAGTATALAAFVAATGVALAEPITKDNYLQVMSPGLNHGNTLEAIPLETSWGNPKPTQAWFDGAKAAGFKSVRIPVAYTQYSAPDNTISKEWLDHVESVVAMTRKAGLIAMVNVHWDGGWLQALASKEAAAGAKLRKFWSQIAKRLAKTDDGVIFAGTNETGVDNEYGPPTEENAKVQNGYNQIFVDAVRATGGKNKTRWLVVQAYNTNIEAAVKVNTLLPKDSVKGRLMMEVHYYSPWHFVLNEKSDIWQWGATAKDPKHTDTWGNEDYADAQFQMMKSAFVDKGIPVLLGEYSCGMKPRFPGMNQYRLKWDDYITRSAFKHGLVPMYWDTGSLLDRTTGKPKDPDLVKLLIAGCKQCLPAAPLGRGREKRRLIVCREGARQSRRWRRNPSHQPPSGL